MTRNQYIQLCGFLGMILLVAGAVLYAINAPNRTFTQVTLAAGALLLIFFAIMNLGEIRTFFGKRSSRYGANMMVMIILFTCIITVIQTLSLRHAKRIDLTRNARFSLATQTLGVLEKLEQEISITAFFKRDDTARAKAENLLKQYAYHSKNIRYEFIDPDRQPQLAKDLGISDYRRTVIQAGEKTEQITALNEETLTNAIMKVTRDVLKGIYFLQGHGEKNLRERENIGYSLFKEAIEKEGYRAAPLSLFEEDAVPDDAYVVIVAGPTKDLFESEIEKLKAFLDTGRSAIFMLDPFNSLPIVEAFLAEYGLAVDNNIIISPYDRQFGREFTIPAVTQYVDHPITRGIDIVTVYPVSRSVRMLGEPATCEAQYLAQTGKTTWGENDLEAYRQGTAASNESDVLGPVPIAAISSKTKPAPADADGAAGEPERSTIVLFGDSDFVANAVLHLMGNADFIMNTINFLAEEKDLIAIRPKPGLGDHISLTASQGRLIFLLAVVLLPLMIITSGTTLYVRRRRRG